MRKNENFIIRRNKKVTTQSNVVGRLGNKLVRFIITTYYFRISVDIKVTTFKSEKNFVRRRK